MNTNETKRNGDRRGHGALLLAVLALAVLGSGCGAFDLNRHLERSGSIDRTLEAGIDLLSVVEAISGDSPDVGFAFDEGVVLTTKSHRRIEELVLDDGEWQGPDFRRLDPLAHLIRKEMEAVLTRIPGGRDAGPGEAGDAVSAVAAPEATRSPPAEETVGGGEEGAKKG